VPREGLQHEAIENDFQFDDMMSQQEMLKKKAAIQKRINEKRIDDMQKTQQNLREKFVEVNDFMKDCMRKAERAEEEIAREEAKQRNLSDDIAAIERDLKELSGFEEKFKEIVESFQPYVDVFNEVIQAGDFQSFEDLMSRCDSLRMYNS
jgi:DNA repair exonuclease SbcCD ATPase subunit